MNWPNWRRRNENLATLLAKTQELAKKREKLATSKEAHVKAYTEWWRLEKVLPRIRREAERLQHKRSYDDKPSTDGCSALKYTYPTFEAAVEAVIATEAQIKAHSRSWTDLNKTIRQLERDERKLKGEIRKRKRKRDKFPGPASTQANNSGKSTLPIKREAPEDDDEIGAEKDKSEAKIKVEVEAKPVVKKVKIESGGESGCRKVKEEDEGKPDVKKVKVESGGESGDKKIKKEQDGRKSDLNKVKNENRGESSEQKVKKKQDKGKSVFKKVKIENGEEAGDREVKEELV